MIDTPSHQLNISEDCSRRKMAGTSVASNQIWSRRGLFLPIGLLVIAGSHRGVAATATTTGTAFTADERAGSVSAIDLPAGRVRTVPLSIMPHNVQVSPDGQTVLLVGMSGHHGGNSGGKLIMLDAADITRAPRSEISIGPHPAHVVTDISGAQAFVTDSAKNAVLIVDLTAGKIVNEIPVGAYPHGLRLSPDGLELYVANMRSSDVSVVDPSAGRELARIAVGKLPVQVGFTPDGTQVYVSLNGENKVAIIDRKRRAVVAKINVGRNPVQVQVTPDGRRVFIANQGTEASPSDTVSVIDTTERKVIATIKSGRGAHGVTVSNDGRLVLVSNIVDSTVSAIGVQELRTIATYRVGAGPNGITYRVAP